MAARVVNFVPALAVRTRSANFMRAIGALPGFMEQQDALWMYMAARQAISMLAGRLARQDFGQIQP